MPDEPDAAHKDMLQRMWLIRCFEERVIELIHRKELAGLVHVGIGQEAVAVGIVTALRENDYLYGTHRSHGHFLARGADPDRLLAELAGKDTGYCRGRGGSMHIVAVDKRLMSATGIVGGTIPLALGTALVAREVCGRAHRCALGQRAGSWCAARSAREIQPLHIARR